MYTGAGVGPCWPPHVGLERVGGGVEYCPATSCRSVVSELTAGLSPGRHRVVRRAERPTRGAGAIEPGFYDGVPLWARWPAWSTRRVATRADSERAHATR
ncbi:hypothetical protein [Mycobacterium tilburgii]